MKRKYVVASALAGAVVSGLGFGAAQASIVSVGEYQDSQFGLTIDTPAPGTAITAEFIENNGLPDGIIFAEKQNYTLTEALALDTGGTLAAGTVVSSYFVGFDNGSGGFQHTFANFSTEVLGIEFHDTNLGASDVLGLPGLIYSTGCGNCGYEPGETASFMDKTASFDSDFSTPGDYARVITAASTGVPEPATWALLVGGFAAAGAALRRRSRAAAA